jgi:hypothetical protein
LSFLRIFFTTVVFPEPVPPAIPITNIRAVFVARKLGKNMVPEKKHLPLQPQNTHV